MTPDLLIQYVNRKQYDQARQALENMGQDERQFARYQSTNCRRALVSLALSSPGLKLPSVPFTQCYLSPAFDQLLTIVRLESIGISKDHGMGDQELIDQLGDGAVEVFRAASLGAPESLRDSTYNKLIEKLLQGGYPREIGLKAKAFKPYRDSYFAQDLGL